MLKHASRLASLGWNRSRGSVHQKPSQQKECLQPQSRSVSQSRETSPHSPALSPVSSSDASIEHSNESSETSTLTNSSFETGGSDISSNIKSDKEVAQQQCDTTEEHAKLILNKGQAHMMHQTSSRLLRMTGDDRPFTKDFKDLFSTLVVSLPLSTHRVRFSRIEHTFTTEEAITNLGSLKFSQSNRMPDPKDPSRIVTTTTTTTFSMAKEMARSVCQRFFDARLVEAVDGRTSDFSSRSTVWQLTPKGMHILGRFCQRNGIHQRHVNDLLESPRNMMQLVILEREAETDKLNHDPATINVLFRRFAGETGPNVKQTRNHSDSDSISDYATGYIGVIMTQQRQRAAAAAAAVAPSYVFTGKAAYDWLMDCCTVVDKREVFELANQFVQHGLIEPFSEDRNANNSATGRFNASRNNNYAVTEKGKRVAGWISDPSGSVDGDATTQQRVPAGVVRDSNTNRMTVIIRDPALRLLFREYLRETHCEENLSFYVEVKAFLADYDSAKRASAAPRLDVIRETLASAYSLYNAFLAPGSPCELNIDHSLRNALAARMTRAVGEDQQMIQSLDEVASLFSAAENSVFKLMASDSVPKFSREPKYAAVLKERNLEGVFAAVSLS
ncbi:hypothetical protein AMS68_002393 [Peltaster fructicola]|uniref:RGS domain-containing protein n=1 Tax=Peltaster fructicola TaxID=286661 RepID=A0A6H0XQA9_9PEZI|nr:hypothetical protein AMS68_002393 [Peltaster fructicola]